MKFHPQEQTQTEQYSKQNLKTEIKYLSWHCYASKNPYAQSNILMLGKTLQVCDSVNGALHVSEQKSRHRELNHTPQSTLTAQMAVPGNVLVESHLTFTETTQV